MAGKVAFVLGGGGHLGAAQVGMLRALLERDIRPDVVVGTSVGALNGAAVAVDPSLEAVERLRSVWERISDTDVLGGSLLARAASLARSRTYLHSNEPLRDLLERTLPAKTFDDVKVPFQCVAACIERAAEHWFERGPLVDAILASTAVPGLLPIVEIGGEHFMDGGIVNSVPISRAIELGATTLYVMHVGRLDRPLEPPRSIWQVAVVAFELARRHRFVHDMERLDEGVIARVLPTGEEPPRYDVVAQLRYRDFTAVGRRIDGAYRASRAYLREHP